MRRVSAIPSTVLDVTEVGDQLVGDLALGPDHLLQANDLVHEHFIRLGELEVLLLQGLDLVLGRGKRFAENDNLLRRAKGILSLRGLARGGRFSADIVQVIFPVCSKLGMAEFPRLDTVS